MSRISGVTLRIAASILLAAMAAPFVGAGAAAAESLPHSSSPAGLWPEDIQNAYKLPSSSAGAWLTVAVIAMYDLPTAESDLATYRSQFGLPACTTANGCFRKVNQNGGSSPYPSTANEGISRETALDIEMVSAACPRCNILLVEMNGANPSDFAEAVDTAVELGAVSVSISLAQAEDGSQAAWDSHFWHAGVAIVAAAGDCGFDCVSNRWGYVAWPAAIPSVVAVGGTILSKDSRVPRGWAEAVWGGGSAVAGGPTMATGSGCSRHEGKPNWQRDFENQQGVTTGCNNRTLTDISAVAVFDDNGRSSGVAIYSAALTTDPHDPYNPDPHWQWTRGTSVATPIIAAAFALAGGPASGTDAASYLYANRLHDPSSFNDIMFGSNQTGTPCGGSLLCNAGAGYDGPTGLGTPNGVDAFKPPTYPPASTYRTITQTRILDTRYNIGLSGAFVGGQSREFQVAGNLGGSLGTVLPAGAIAVTGNLTVTGQTHAGRLYIGPDLDDNPGTSTLNFPLNDTRANGVTVRLNDREGHVGKVAVTYSGAGSGYSTHVLFDVTGYYMPDSSGKTYHPVAPARILDTRSGIGLTGVFTAYRSRGFQVTGQGGVPPNAKAVTGNLTVTQQTAGGYLYIGPTQQDAPTTSILNFPVNDNRANGVTVRLSSAGTLFVTYGGAPSGSTTHVLFDVTGYFTDDSTGYTYHALSPARLLDDRVGTGLRGDFSAKQARSFPAAGRLGVPSNAKAVTGNLTVTGQTAAGHLYIGPNGASVTTTSTLNFPVGDVRANGVTVLLNADGTLTVYYYASSGNSTDVVFDVTGYFTD
jgi:hypothetical protein